MSVYQLAYALQSLVCVVGLVVILMMFWAEARLDAFRQRLFLIRDELFDYASNGNIGFDDPAYRQLRRFMNGSIRYAHQLTFFRLLVTVAEVKVLGKSGKSNWAEDWNRALAKIPRDDVRQSLQIFHDRAMTAAAVRLITGSPVMIALLIFFLPFLAIQMGWQNLKQIAKRAPIYTVSHVVDTRLIEDQAAAAAPA